MELRDYENFKMVLSVGEEKGVMEDFICNFKDSSMYLGDAIQEFSNNYVDIYTSDLWENAYIFSDYIEEAIQEFGWDGCGSELTRAFMMGQYLFYESLLYSNLEDVIYNIGVEHINDSNIELTEEQEEELEELLDEALLSKIDNNSRISKIIDLVEELLDMYQEGEDEE